MPERHPVEELELALAHNAVLFRELYPALLRPTPRGASVIVCDNCVSGSGGVQPVNVQRRTTRDDWPNGAEHAESCDGSEESAEATGCKAEPHPVDPLVTSDVVDLCPTCADLLQTGRFGELADRNVELPGATA